MPLRMANIDYHTKIAAPFVTTEIFVKGCNVVPKCKGCWNPELWSFEGPAREFEPEELADLLMDSVPYRRLTICGGEPFAQAKELAEMCQILKEEGNFFIMSYTGWTWEELFNGEANGIDPLDALSYIEQLDVLVDGRYEASNRNHRIGDDFEWVGSTNQRIIDVQKSLASGIPAVIDADGVFRIAETYSWIMLY